MSQSVLVVDDEPNIVISLEYVMKNAGYQVDTAYDGEDALSKIKDGTPDLVILDVMMPKRDGFDVLKTVREDPSLNTVRIMMLTAKGRDEEREKGLALGANDYMTKPFSTRDVVARAKVLLDQPTIKEAAQPAEKSAQPAEEAAQPAGDAAPTAEETAPPAEEAAQPAKKAAQSAEEAARLAKKAAQPSKEGAS